MYPHYSVLLNEVLSFFKDSHLDKFVDCTLGAGGHSEAFLQNHPEIQWLMGIDQDPLAAQIVQKRLGEWKKKLLIVQGNFVSFSDYLDKYKIDAVDGIVFDLGVSSMQLDIPEKGFSFMHKGPLDMRMDPNNPITAAEILNSWSEEEIGRIFRDYGEEKQWRLAARSVIHARKKTPFVTTEDLTNALYPVLHRKAKKGLHPLTLIFQGLRIAVNSELEVLEEVLPRAIERLKPKGRLAVISFHSLEDRIVKNTFRYEASDKEDTAGLAGLFKDKKPTIKILTPKPIIPGEQEILQNPRSRSAKLRVAEKL